MTDDLNAFRDLAWRALEAPTDAALRTEVADALSEHPTWADEWRILRETHHLAQSAMPAALAIDDADRTTAISAHRLAALLKKPRPVSRSRRWLPFIVTLAACAVFSFFIFRPDSPDLSRWTASAPAKLTRALTAPLSEVLATAVIPTMRDSTSVKMRSPLLAAQAGLVLIDWADAATTPVTITLRENGRTLWTSPRVTAPTLTPDLAPDRAYELILTPTSGPAVRERFITVANSPELYTGFDAVLAPATAEPARLGEAVLAWHDLPENLRNSETGRRIGAWLAVEARQPDMLAEVRADR